MSSYAHEMIYRDALEGIASGASRSEVYSSVGHWVRADTLDGILHEALSDALGIVSAEDIDPSWF